MTRGRLVSPLGPWDDPREVPMTPEEREAARRAARSKWLEANRDLANQRKRERKALKRAAA